MAKQKTAIKKPTKLSRINASKKVSEPKEFKLVHVIKSEPCENWWKKLPAKPNNLIVPEKEILHIYTRVNGNTQKANKFSGSAQVKSGIYKAKKLGMDYMLFEETGHSSTTKDNFRDTPKLNELMKLVKNRTAKHIFVDSMDRLTRVKAIELTQIFDKYGVQIHTPEFSAMSVGTLTDEDKRSRRVVRVNPTK
jgi:hypothetical protein